MFENFICDGILLNVCFEDNWREIYEQTKAENTVNGERYTLPDGRVYENRNDQLTLIHDPGKEEKLMDIEDIEPRGRDYSIEIQSFME